MRSCCGALRTLLGPSRGVLGAPSAPPRATQRGFGGLQEGPEKAPIGPQSSYMHLMNLEAFLRPSWSALTALWGPLSALLGPSRGLGKHVPIVSIRGGGRENLSNDPRPEDCWNCGVIAGYCRAGCRALYGLVQGIAGHCRDLVCNVLQCTAGTLQGTAAFYFAGSLQKGALQGISGGAWRSRGKGRERSSLRRRRRGLLNPRPPGWQLGLFGPVRQISASRASLRLRAGFR